jgi:hypothetical protein
MTITAYDDILEYSSTKQFSDFRRVLIGNRGTIASGNLAEGLTLLFDKNESQKNIELFANEEQKKQVPVNLVQKIGRGQPGLIFNKNGYEEVLRQVESRGEIAISNLVDKLKFTKDSDAEIWKDSSDITIRRCVSRNLDKLIKETQIQYRVHGDRMHYLTVGQVVIETYQGKTERYPLFLFSCPELDLSKLTAQVESTGFVNFWLDKNIFDNEIAKKRSDNFEITLDSNFANEVNTISQYLNGVNLSAKYKSITVDPSYMSFQIVTGFEAEYVDSAWGEIMKADSK